MFGLIILFLSLTLLHPSFSMALDKVCCIMMEKCTHSNIRYSSVIITPKLCIEIDFSLTDRHYAVGDIKFCPASGKFTLKS